MSFKNITIFLVLLLSIPSLAQSSTLELGGEPATYSLETYFSSYLDSSANASITEITEPALRKEFIHSTNKPLNAGVTDSACWIMFSVKNPGDKARRMVLELGTSTINSAVLFIPDGKNGYKGKTTGDKHPIEMRDYFHRRPCFSLTIPARNTQTYFLRLETNAILETSLSLMDEDYFISRLPLEYMLLGMFYAAFLVAIAYNLFLYASLHDTSRILYVLYALTFCSLWLFLDGLWHMAGLSEFTFDQLTGARVTNAGTCMTMVLFTSWFFNCRKNAPRLHWLFMLITLWSVVNMVMVCILPLAEYKGPVRLAWVASIPTIIFTAALFMKRGFLRARYFLAAWLLVLAGATIMFMDMYLNLLPSNIITRYIWRIASVFEFILLSLALADRINELNRDRDLARIQALEAERRLKEGLEEVVAKRTQELEMRSIELEKANRKLEELSQVDELTGLFNRRYFDAALKTEWLRMKRSNSYLCLLMVDVDHFKLYNDTYGHPTGDLCLQSVAKSLKHGANRSSDICARYGGEEFALILPGTDLEGGKVIAWTILRHVSEKHIPHATETGFVTVSIGVSAIVPCTDNSPEALLKAADQALYRSKQDGRNRVSISAE